MGRWPNPFWPRRAAGASVPQRLATREAGQVLILFALSLFVLFGAIAVAIDGSRIFEERRASQAAIDHAVTTAAFTRCTGGTEAQAIAAGLAAADRNGYDNDGASNTVAFTAIGGNVFRGDLASSIDATFGRVIGFDHYDVSTTATGDCTGGGPGNVGAIFAGGDNCTGGKWGFDSSGSNQRVYGGVHTNSDANIGSSPNWWTDWTLANPNPPPDPFTYHGLLKENPPLPGNVFEPLYPRAVSSVPWPTGYGPGQVVTRIAELGLEQLAIDNGTRFNSKVDTITKNGVYYTSSTDGMDIGSVSAGVDTVTLVAPNGPIKISVSNRTFHAHTGGLVMVSGVTFSGTEKCDKFAIAISGQASVWDGLLWAPGGLIEFSGSDTSSVNGTLLGWAVRLNGSNITIVNNPALFATPPNVLLLE